MALTFTNTTKYALRKLTGGNIGSDIDAGFAALGDDLDAVMVGYGQGAYASRPVSTSGSPGKAGRLYYANDLDALYFDLGTAWRRISPAAGTISAFAGPSPPSGTFFCDGAAVSRTTYAELFANLGTNFGTGNGTTTFNLPDLRGRVPVGVDGAASRLTSNRSLGSSAGEEKHTLVIAEMPPHHHVEVAQVAGGGTSGTITGPASSQENTLYGGPQTTQDTGGGGSHNNMPPYQVVQWIVKL